MAGYNNVIGNIVRDLQNGNMQKHMGTMGGEISSNRQRILQDILNYEFAAFTRYLYETALGRHERYYDGKLLKAYLEKNEDDLLPIFGKVNEEALNDPELSKALANGYLYTKEMAEEKDHILFYVPKKVGSISHDIYMKLLYVPSQSPDKPNAMRLEAGEQLEEGKDYPYITFSVDIGDDGSLTYNDPMIIEKKEVDGKEVITNTPASMDDTRICFSDKGIEAIRDVFMNIFEKTGIKEEIGNKKH